ncbi:hypothetical protein WN48_05353 [Eufriesea mexicana]|nr:hypothetical protein WN48_05353 [Eufriesea mexicana]
MAAHESFVAREDACAKAFHTWLRKYKKAGRFDLICDHVANANTRYVGSASWQ